MGTMTDFILFGLSLILFSLGVWFMLRRSFAYFVPSRFARHRVSWRCNKHANHTTYILTVCDAVVRWTYIHPRRPSHNGLEIAGKR